MGFSLPMFAEPPGAPPSGRLRRYGDVLTVDINGKGVLDVDTVKGCTAGMNARPGTGCYGGCYAAKIAKYRGIDFSVAVTRTVQSHADARAIERAVRAAPEGFFRIGTMGDPCHAWEHAVSTVEWLAPLATPVIITKHWIVATDDQVGRLVTCGAVLNTSVSALDTVAELAHREQQIARYASLGGVSVARIVSCDFNAATSEGRRMAATQDRLFALRPVLDNPLRVPASHPLVQAGVIRIAPVRDLGERPVSVSKTDPATYTGHCSGCPDKCGLVYRGPRHPQPIAAQLSLKLSS